MENYFNDSNFQLLPIKGTFPAIAEYPHFAENKRTFQNCRYFDPYNGKCLYCHEGYALDANGLICSRVIDYCAKYKTSYECQECEKGYQLFIDLS